MGTEDEERAAEWEQAGKTELDKTAVRPVSDVITAPHDLAAIAGSIETEISKARDEACRLCWGECQADAIAALRSILLERGLTNDETAHVVLLFKGNADATLANDPRSLVEHARRVRLLREHGEVDPAEVAVLADLHGALRAEMEVARLASAGRPVAENVREVTTATHGGNRSRSAGEDRTVARLTGDQTHAECEDASSVRVNGYSLRASTSRA